MPIEFSQPIVRSLPLLASSNVSSFICPYPLQSFDPSTLGQKSARGAATTTLVAYENCAVPCPMVDFTPNEWSTLCLTITILVCLSMTTSFISFFSHLLDRKRHYILCMFTGGFFGYSTILSFFLFRNGPNNEIICNGTAQYVKQDPVCVFQAASTVFLFLWIEIWSVILAWDTYLHITTLRSRSDSENKRLLRRYTWFAVIFSIGITIVPLCYSNLGFDPKASIPICFFLGSDTKVSLFFWGSFFAPFYILLFIFLVISCGAIRRIHLIFVTSQSYLARYRAPLSTDNLQQMSSNRMSSNQADEYSGMEGDDLSGSLTKALLSGSLHEHQRPSSVDRNSFLLDLEDDNRGSGMGMMIPNSQLRDSAHSATYLDDDMSSSSASNLSFSFRSFLNFGTSSKQQMALTPSTQAPSVDVSPVKAFGNPNVHTNTSTNVNANSFADLRRQSHYNNPNQPFSSSHTSGKMDSTSSGLAINTQGSSLQSNLMNPIITHNGKYYSDQLAMGTSSQPRPTRSPRKEKNVPEYEGDTPDQADDEASMPGNDVMVTGRPRDQDTMSEASTISAPSRHPAYQDHENDTSLGSENGDMRYEDLNWATLDGRASSFSSTSPTRTACSSTSHAQSANLSQKATFLSNNPTASLTLTDILYESMKYNGKTFLFVFAFGISTIVIGIICVDQFFIEYSGFIDSADNFVECLVYASVMSPIQTQDAVDSFAASTCGNVPSHRPSLPLLYSILVWVGSFGMVPALIFRCSLLREKIVHVSNRAFQRLQGNN